MVINSVTNCGFEGGNSWALQPFVPVPCPPSLAFRLSAGGPTADLIPLCCTLQLVIPGISQSTQCWPNAPSHWLMVWQTRNEKGNPSPLEVLLFFNLFSYIKEMSEFKEYMAASKCPRSDSAYRDTPVDTSCPPFSGQESASLPTDHHHSNNTFGLLARATCPSPSQVIYIFSW